MPRFMDRALGAWRDHGDPGGGKKNEALKSALKTANDAAELLLANAAVAGGGRPTAESSVASIGLLRGICLFTGAALHAAPLPTMREIMKSRSTLNYHIAPYASTLLNHTINGYYAIVRQDGALILHRAVGILCQAFYLHCYLQHCPPARYADAKKFVVRTALVFLAMLVELHVALPLLGLSEKHFFTHLALFAALTGIGLAASPLATLREVVTNRDSSSLPLGLCAMVTIQCSAWTLYGWQRRDWSTFANNAVGVVLGSLQLLLIFSCPNKRTKASGVAGTGILAHGKAKRDDNPVGAAATPRPALGKGLLSSVVDASPTLSDGGPSSPGSAVLSLAEDGQLLNRHHSSHHSQHQL